ncbi:hypothetical protein RIF23_13060 [Lipingzhangella sp. LS1_29]|uniref:YtxH-like protein n=1 Tax=Lipingzhangella rawalii TaxID=2055835 RepID=A0ABU2H7D1_9ACTN|nr:hypothetical protein [Lipingzhangella rawalii]MDS1271226.1 hypothetical protein [Lipingzhangella rawalii]
MRYRITFAAGLAVGYVLGTRAGRRRYEQITRMARRVADSPAAQETAGLIGSQVTRAGRKVRTTIVDRVPGVHDFLDRPSPQEQTELNLWDEVPEPRDAGGDTPPIQAEASRGDSSDPGASNNR